MRRRQRRRSGGLLMRVVARSAGVAAVVLIAGALGARAVISTGQMEATRMLAASQAANILAETAANVRLAGDFGSLPYELVGSNGAVVSSSSSLKDLEKSGPVMPVPIRNAQQYVDRTYRAPAAVENSSVLAGTTIAAGSTLRASAVSSAAPDRPGNVPDGGAYRVYVFVTPAAARAALAGFDGFVWPGVLLAVLLVSAAAASAVRSALRTVEGIRAHAAAVGGSAQTDSIDIPTHDRELRELALTLNGMIARLRAAQETQRRFATDAAHELRSPISSLVAALEIAAHYPDQIDERGALQHALQQAHTLQQLASDLLASAGADSRPPHVVQVAIDVVVAEATPALRPDLVLQCELEPAELLVDAARIGRAVSNVLRNADRHAPHRICISGRRDGPTRYRLCISNDGEPIPARDRERIFDAFARLDEGRARDVGGAGLGLAIARRDVESTGGTLRAVYAERGARFEFVLPTTF